MSKRKRNDAIAPKEIRLAVHDPNLNVSACLFDGISQPFPDHFHDWFTIGLIEQGERHLHVKNQEYELSSGTLLFFAPGDVHGCQATSPAPLVWKSLVLSRERMAELMESTGFLVASGCRLCFSSAVSVDPNLVECFRQLHEQILQKESDLSFEKQEDLLRSFLQSLLSSGILVSTPDLKGTVSSGRLEPICTWIDQQIMAPGDVHDLCLQAGLSHSTLIRWFTQDLDITPLHYLESVRLAHACRMLEGGCSLAQTALESGYCDQSHFTNRFRSVLGVSPGQFFSR